jgi:hypothetical protein
MQAAIYLQILDDTGSYAYEKPILNEIKQSFPQLLIYDFDTRSDSLVVGCAVDLLEKSDKALVIIEASDGSASGLVIFLEKIIACKDKCMVLLYGRNNLVERMLHLLDEDSMRQMDTDTQLTNIAIAYLSDGQP